MIDGTCEIWHKESYETMFRPFKPGDMMTFKYAYPVAIGYGPEDAWRDNNVVSGNEFPVTHQTRSLSVGDGVILTTAGGQEYFYVADVVGFKTVSSDDFYKGIEA